MLNRNRNKLKKINTFYYYSRIKSDQINTTNLDKRTKKECVLKKAVQNTLSIYSTGTSSKKFFPSLYS